MGDFPSTTGWGTGTPPLLGDPTHTCISPISANSLGPGGPQASPSLSVAWPSANLSIFVPFRVSHPVTVDRIAMGGGPTATGNYDAGVYDHLGNRLVSTGAQAKPASAETVVNVTNTTFGPGLFYMALAADGTQNIVCWQLQSAQLGKALGLREVATNYTLGAGPVTLATYATGAVIPAVCLYLVWV